MLSCPLCGKQNSLRYFNPEALSQNDIQAIELRGLGRGKAWEIVGRPSVLDDKELTSRIAARCRTILKIIGEEVTGEAEANDFEEAIEELQDEKAVLQGEVDSYEEEMDSLLTDITKSLSDVYEGDFSNLKEAVSALIAEYSECIEEAEDEDEDDF
jgi:soluble cytochrome b562